MHNTATEFQVDDMTIRFRCGDLLLIGSMGFHRNIHLCRVCRPNSQGCTIHWYLDPITRDSGQQRVDDREKNVVHRCKILVYSLVAYIQHFHPNVDIHVHNDRNEIIALTYARMIMARQSSITGMTSFGEFGTSATVGTGYIRSPGQWIRPIAELNNTIPLFGVLRKRF